jgi:hypothetical protein
VFAGTGTINTSDADLKQDARSVGDKEIAASKDIRKKMKAYKFKSSVAKKGDGARIHFGILAQEVQKSFKDAGLNAEDYGLYCKNEVYEIDGESVEVDSQGFYHDCYYTIEGVRVADEVAMGTADKKGRMPEYVVFHDDKYKAKKNIRHGIRYEELLCFLISSVDV